MDTLVSLEEKHLRQGGLNEEVALGSPDDLLAISVALTSRYYRSPGESPYDILKVPYEVPLAPVIATKEGLLDFVYATNNINARD
jgi:hypothetical protein